MMTMLSLDRVTVAYGRKQILHDISLGLEEGEIAALVGHNGAGKTTVLRTAIGLVAPAAGEIIFDGVPVLADKTAAAVARGLAFVPQGRNTFRSMTVAENLDIAVSAGGEAAPGRMGLIDEMFPILRERKTSSAGKLSGGQQQMLALACALLRGPRLIMLDEPSTGLAPVLVDEVFRRVADMRDRLGVSVLVVDQNVTKLLKLVDRIFVLKAGRIVFSGRPADIDGDEQLWSLF
ncbi:branched-chain amino acid transport system ATP-binding protein [Rhodoligotrophos appendicifer]|uniref:ABC transporter ATP-binding protein n=1 Tax=Rhodoligotrophos appendicifer TaxID=987056 RepID=UPI001186B078|nr:ABC transporter ATP-binding protein [Rhodoligotrophos appendicifer]